MSEHDIDCPRCQGGGCEWCHNTGKTDELSAYFCPRHMYLVLNSAAIQLTTWRKVSEFYRAIYDETIIQMASLVLAEDEAYAIDCVERFLSVDDDEVMKYTFVCNPRADPNKPYDEHIYYLDPPFMK